MVVPRQIWAQVYWKIVTVGTNHDFSKITLALKLDEERHFWSPIPSETRFRQPVVRILTFYREDFRNFRSFILLVKQPNRHFGFQNFRDFLSRVYLEGCVIRESRITRRKIWAEMDPRVLIRTITMNFSTIRDPYPDLFLKPDPWSVIHPCNPWSGSKINVYTIDL